MSDDNYEILGRQIVNELVGDAGKPGAFDPSFLINAAAEITERGVQYKQDQDAASKAAKDVAARTQRAITADAAWAGAEATLDLAQQSGNAQQIASAQALAQAAAASALASGVGLPQDAIDKRVAAAQDGAKKAAQDSLSAPSDAAKAAKMRAWQKVAISAASAPATPSPASTAMVPAGGGGHMRAAGGGENIFTKSYGGVPGWGWALGGAGVLTGLILLLRRR